MIKELKVLNCGKHGAKFEGGIEIPYNEMKGIYKRGEKVLVYVADDEARGVLKNDSKKDLKGEKSQTLSPSDAVFMKDSRDGETAPITSAKIYNQLVPTDKYKVGDTVQGIVYEKKSEMGAFVAVDDLYHGLIPLNELYKEVAIGNRIEARVTKVTDGKLRLSVRKKAKEQMDIDAAMLREELKKSGGVLYLTDDSDPAVIKKRLNLSKKAFKRAVGRLLKQGKIELKADSIELIR